MHTVMHPVVIPCEAPSGAPYAAPCDASPAKPSWGEDMHRMEQAYLEAPCEAPYEVTL